MQNHVVFALVCRFLIHVFFQYHLYPFMHVFQATKTYKQP